LRTGLAPRSPAAKESPEPAWARKYPPLFGALVLGLAALAALPSSFTLPQPETAQTREYAPVPPSNEPPDTPAESNLSSLSLATSSGVRTGGASGGQGAGGGPGLDLQRPVPALTGAGRNPSNKRCVGDPLRQTEDPLAPPCVPYFNGDNGGATYRGVTRDEVRVLIYFEGGYLYSDGTKSPEEAYVDLLDAPGENEDPTVRAFRGWQRYFNDRFQTYGRLVHFIVYFDSSGRGSPEARRADAADNHAKVDPFAVVSYVRGNEDDYLREMARRGVLNFGSYSFKPSSFFTGFPRLIWSYDPSVEQQAAQYLTYICSKVVGRDSVLAAPDLNGRPRKIGILHTTDERYEGLLFMAELVRAGVESCGGRIEAEATFPRCCYAQDNSDTGTYGQEAMADFKTKGITTILWPGGINGNFGKWAASMGYYPEWIVLGDGVLDARNPVGVYSQLSASFDGRAIVVSPQPLLPAFEEQRCYLAYREADETLDDGWVRFACEYYRTLFQLFTGIQVAGPRLDPASVDEGFHAIPRIQTNDVERPSCFYDPGDYTCVKDAIAEIWRASNTAPGSSTPGCWAAIEHGKRYLAGRWPEGNVDAQLTGDEPCNGYNATTEVIVA
jgi:hypothetical protein